MSRAICAASIRSSRCGSGRGCGRGTCEPSTRAANQTPRLEVRCSVVLFGGWLQTFFNFFSRQPSPASMNAWVLVDRNRRSFCFLQVLPLDWEHLMWTNVGMLLRGLRYVKIPQAPEIGAAPAGSSSKRGRSLVWNTVAPRCLHSFWIIVNYFGWSSIIGMTMMEYAGIWSIMVDY